MGHLRKSKIAIITTFLVIIALLVSCQSPRVPELPYGWTKIVLDKSVAQCAYGDSYAFWVRPGTENKLVIFFQGGGACWNGQSCSPKNNLEYGIYNACVDCEGKSPSQQSGIFDYENEKNPFSSYHFVVIPYCTADLHWGDKETNYVSGNDGRFSIQHKGFVNASAVLDWIYIHYSKPESILIAGTSAGGYGAILHAAYIIDKYPNSKVSLLSDSSVVFPPSFDFEPNFGALANFPNPENSSESGVSSPCFNLVQFYIYLAEKYPKNTFALMSFSEDSTQLRTYQNIENHYNSIGVFCDSLEERDIRESLNEINESGLDNLKTCMIAESLPFLDAIQIPNTVHGILSSDFFLKILPLKNWVFELAESGSVSESEVCQ